MVVEESTISMEATTPRLFRESGELEELSPARGSDVSLLSFAEDAFRFASRADLPSVTTDPSSRPRFRSFVLVRIIKPSRNDFGRSRKPLFP